MFRVKAEARFSHGWHCHPEFELTCIQASQGQRLVGDSIENYRSGDLVLLGPDVPHTWNSEEIPPSRESKRPLHRAIVIQFDGNFLGRGFFDAPEFETVASLLARANRGLRIEGTTRDWAAREMAAMARRDRFERLVSLLRILQRLSLSRDDDVTPISRFPVDTAPARSAQRRIDQLLRYLRERFAGEVSQREVAALVGMTPPGFSRFFRRTTGTTFVDYLSELRVSRACNLLIDTDHSVLEISLASGFNNLSNFNRRFSRLKGMTPREYRRHHRKPAG